MTASKNRILAVNLAREGVEAVRNIRDTNWLKFSSKRRQCWNQLPKNPGECDGTKIGVGEFIIYKHTSSQWRLKKLNAANYAFLNEAPYTLDLSPYPETLLKLVDIDPAVNSDNVGGNADDSDIYNNIDPTGISFSALGKNNIISESPFNRYVTIEYLKNDGTRAINNVIHQILTAPPIQAILDKYGNPATQSIIAYGSIALNDRSLLNRMLVTSTVVWQEGTRPPFSVELKTVLTDYLGRENLIN